MCGQSTFSSCNHVGGQRKAKMDKSTIGQKPQGIKIKVDKTPKRENILILQNQGVRSHDHMIQVWTINILVMRSHGRTEKIQNGQKHRRTKDPKDKPQSGQNPQKRKYFNSPTIMVYDHMIT